MQAGISQRYPTASSRRRRIIYVAFFGCCYKVNTIKFLARAMSLFAQIAFFKMQPGTGQAVVEFFQSDNGLAVTRASQGCIQFDVLTDVSNPDMIRIFEKWDSQANFEAYLKFRQDSGDMNTLVQNLAAPPEFIPLSLIG